jgi:hypothetical protein
MRRSVPAAPVGSSAVQTLERSQIAFHPGSTGKDADGRLFEWEGELYRGIHAANAQGYLDLLSSDAFQRLAGRGALVPTEASDLQLEGFELVVRHERLPRVSYPFEWSWPMLKDAGLALLDVNLELVRAGYLTKDPSSWNVLFVDTRPAYVDFTNIWPLERTGYALTTWPEWFRAYYTYPLRLVAEGKARVVRRLVADYDRGIAREEMIELGLHLRERAEREARRVARGVRARVRARVPAAPPVPAGPPYYPPERWAQVVRELREELEAIDVPVPKTKWSGYYDLSLSPNAPAEGLTAKHRNVEAVIDRVAPETVIDIGASTGWFSKLATEKGARVVVLEADESAVARLYFDARRAQLSILPLVMDITRPTHAHGIAGTRVSSASDRLSGDLVLLLAVVHHLAVGLGLDLEAVVASVAPFAKRWLLFEWVDPADETLQGYFGDAPTGYTEDALRAALSREFEIRETFDSHPGTRRLLLCERRQT